MAARLVAVLLLFLSVSAHSDPAHSDSIWKIAVGLIGMENDGPYILAWTLHNFMEPPASGATTRLHESTMAVSYCDCKQRKSALLRWMNFSVEFARGEMLSSGQTGVGSLRCKDVVPESMGEAVLDVVCAARIRI